jgi:hypothetical protein
VTSSEPPPPPPPQPEGESAVGWGLEPVWTEPAERTWEGVEQPPPVPSPFARLSTRPGRLVPAAFELLTRSTADLRRASFYIGLLVAGTVAPFALLIWRVSVEFDALSVVERIDRLTGGVEGAINASVVIAVIGLSIANIESRAVAATLLAARLEGRQLELRPAVERSRRVFWRIVRATILTTVPLLLVQVVTERLAAETFRGESEVSVISAGIVTTILLAPFAYIVTGIVLGDVAALDAVRRSVRLFRARKVAALIVALFAWSAQLLTSFGVVVGLDLVLRAAGLTSLFSSTDAAATALTAFVLVILVFAVGTLLFTVTAISVAPQVVMFLALTHMAPGLDVARAARNEGRPRFRWLTRPYIGLVGGAVLVLLAGLRDLGG